MSNYNEDDSDDFEEDDPDTLAPSYWVEATVEEDVAAIDAILNHRARQDIREWFTNLVGTYLTRHRNGYTQSWKGRFRVLRMIFSSLCIVTKLIRSRLNGKAKHITMQHGNAMALWLLAAA